MTSVATLPVPMRVTLPSESNQFCYAECSPTATFSCASLLPCHPRHHAILADPYEAADEDARALEAQTERRAARRAEHERGIKQRAREAAASLRRGGGDASKAADSAKFARDYALEIAKRVGMPGLHRKIVVNGLAHRQPVSF